MQAPSVKSGPSLARAIGGAGFFTLAFGSIVGSGWVVVLGEWIAAAGPGGALIGFLAGGVLMAMVAAAYAELVARLPRAGCECTFALEGIGPRCGFITGWFLCLYIVSFTAFEAIALSWFLEMLFPALAQGPVPYRLLGHDVSLFALLLGVCGAVLLGIFNSLGAHLAVGLQRLITFAFIGLSLLLILLGFWKGDPQNWHPFFLAPEKGSLGTGIFWVFATSTLFLSGFQSAANAIEERSVGTSFRTVARAMIGGVAGAAAFYCLIILASTALVPWRDLLSQSLPVAAAFQKALPNGLASKIILIAAIISLAKTWSALHLSASRLVLAQARAGFLPAALAKVDPVHGVPRRAILFVAACTCLGVCLGRGAILPIINMSTICVTLIVVLSLIALLRVRRRQGARPGFVLAGGTPLVLVIMLGAAVAAVVAVVSPFQAATGVPLEFLMMGGMDHSRHIVLVRHDASACLTKIARQAPHHAHCSATRPD